MLNDMVQESSRARASRLCLAFSVALCAVGLRVHADTIYVSNYIYPGGTIAKFTASGVGSIFASGLNGPAGMVLDREGNLYVANYLSNTIEKITPTGVHS